MLTALKTLLLLSFIRTNACLQCFQCDNASECRAVTKPQECVGEIYNLLQPACGTETSSTGVRRFCVARDNSNEFGCVSVGDVTTCSCGSDGCNSAGGTARAIQLSMSKETAATDATPASHNTQFQQGQFEKGLQCFDCRGCKTAHSLTTCPRSTTHCLSITTGDLVRRTCGSGRTWEGCSRTKNSLGTQTETCYCAQDYCNFSAIVQPSKVISLLLTTAVAIMLLH